MIDQSELFPVAIAYKGDPLAPDLINPTPAQVVAGLTRSERELRVTRLVEQAHTIVRLAIAEHGRAREVVARCVLFSGGNDSTVLAHIFRQHATHALMANTTIGIEETRQFVRDTCTAWGLPLIEKLPPKTYEQLVCEPGEDGLIAGFPGPAMHWKMYTRLKERCFDEARHDLGVAGSRTTTALFLAGRRRAESERRADAPMYEADGSVIWISPLIMWTKLDLTTYRLIHATADPVPVNQVADVLHMSGECCCGAYAKPDELEQIRDWYPKVAQQIDAIQARLRAIGVPSPFDTWGHGMGRKPSKTGRLCGKCELNQLALEVEP